ncbi:MAG: hypothetical protein EOO85_33890, partial [Pedobacter sp.]
MKILWASLLLFSTSLPAQKQERQILTYNIALGAISAGVGAVINKPKHADWKRYIVKGIWQGSIGGLINYSGKKTLYLINKKNELGYAWPAKILHAAGTSIIENAALNEPFLRNWNIDIGPARIDFSTSCSKKIRARFLPGSIYAILKGSRRGKMDWQTTFRTGTISYYSTNYIASNNSFPAAGLSYGRGIIYSDYGGNTNNILAHELAHTFQYRDYMVLNSFLKPLATKLRK